MITRLKEWWKDYKLRREISKGGRLYKNDEGLSNILNALILSNSKKIVLFKTYRKWSGSGEYEYTEIPPTDEYHNCYDCYIIFKKHDTNEVYVLEFWYANMYYGWMHSGKLTYYPNPNDPNNPTSLGPTHILYRWDDKMPDKDVLFKYAKLVQTWIEEKKKSLLMDTPTMYAN